MGETLSFYTVHRGLHTQINTTPLKEQYEAGLQHIISWGKFGSSALEFMLGGLLALKKKKKKKKILAKCASIKFQNHYYASMQQPQRESVWCQGHFSLW